MGTEPQEVTRKQLIERAMAADRYKTMRFANPPHIYFEDETRAVLEICDYSSPAWYPAEEEDGKFALTYKIDPDELLAFCGDCEHAEDCLTRMIVENFQEDADNDFLTVEIRARKGSSRVQ